MRFFVLLSLLCLPATVAWNQDPNVNVNSRYTVESVDLPSKYEAKLTKELREQIHKLVGEKFSQETLDRMTKRMRQELRYVRVIPKLVKGSKEAYVRVVYEVERPRRDNDIILPRLVYSSKQNWTLGADASLGTHDDKVRFGMLPDNDQLLERYSGILRGSEPPFNDRVRLPFAPERWH